MGTLHDLERSILPATKLRDEGCPTVSIAILEDGRIESHVITAGKENTETVYQACSISKAITAVAVARLVDMGKISYDTKIASYLPQSVVQNLVTEKTEHLMDHVTVAMLLSHTSGVSQHGFPGYSGELPNAEDIIAGNSPSNTPKFVFNSVPGTHWQYAGGGYLLLQLVLEKIVGSSFAGLMQELVLRPLHMTRSWYTDLPSGETNFATCHYTGYVGTDAPYHRFVEKAAAGLWTTPTDLLKCAAAIQNSLSSDGEFLTKNTATKMLQAVSPTGKLGGFALGWSVDKTCFAHSGDNIPAYISYLVGYHGGQLNPDNASPISNGRGRAVAVMSNSVDPQFSTIRRIISAIYFLRGWGRYSQLPSGFGDDDFSPYAAPANTPIDPTWREWIGKWGDCLQVSDHQGPAVVFTPGIEMRLVPAAAPVDVLTGGRTELVFAVDGLNVGLRFTWKDDCRVVQLLNTQSRVLEKSS